LVFVIAEIADTAMVPSVTRSSLRRHGAPLLQSSAVFEMPRLARRLDDAQLKAAVADAGYEVVAITQ
jgi:hypothetical protein